MPSKLKHATAFDACCRCNTSWACKVTGKSKPLVSADGTSLQRSDSSHLQFPDRCQMQVGHICMQVFADLGVLTPTEVDDAISIEFNPVRIALDGSAEIETSNILNCGVSPRKVLDFVKRRFLDHGG